MKVNGKMYPLWSQFVERKDEQIGGILEDFGDDGHFSSSEPMKTIITNIELRSNWAGDSAFFEVVGEDFGCGFNVQYGGISPANDITKKWLEFYGYGGHRWRIKKPI